MIRINHAQIAAAAGVSRSTVSRALQNHPALPAATRRRIQALARKMGYRPNPLVSALMAARNQPHTESSTATLAILTAWHPSKELAPLPTNRRYLQGVQQRAEDLGFRFEEIWLDEPGLTGNRLDQILVNRGIVAVLFAPIPVDHPPIHLQWEHFSLAAFAPSRQIPILHRASHFHFQSCCRAVRRLLELGYRRPALILPRGDLSSHVGDQWIGGFYAATHDLPGKDRLPVLVAPSLDREAILAWCRAHRPDVVLSHETRIPGWLPSLPRMARPAFAHLDRHPDLHPEFAGIDQMHELIGSAAVDLIVAQLNRNERGVPPYPKDLLLEGRWVDGPSAPGR